MADLPDMEHLVRTRLRSLRQTQGWSLDDLAARSHLSASTISRIETGKRSITLDVLVALAGALQVDMDSLLDMHHDDDVVIRPVAAEHPGRTTWVLSRPTGNTYAVKMRLDPVPHDGHLGVHPGFDWFFVLEGQVMLRLGEREIVVNAGEAAEFGTMTPHSFWAVDEPAELIMVFDGEGRRAHVHTDAP